ncbi:MAG: hypothetical protein AB8B93_00465 [Pseudomonadales bacterium]
MLADDAISAAFAGGKPLLRMHARAEMADDESNGLDDANGLTLRTYFGYQTGEVGNFSVRVAAENVLHLVDDFNVPGERSNGADVIADPQGTELEEAFIRYTGFKDTTITAGRQYVTFRPAPLHRFVGTVPWRQNWQSMDAISVENRSIKGLRINYAYINEVNRIFGNDNPNPGLASSPMRSHLINAQYSDAPIGSIEGFYYRLNYDNDALAAPFTDRETIGIKLQGQRALATDLSAGYLVELSHQRAIEDNQTDFDSANQYRLELSLTSNRTSGFLNSITGKVGYEVLESDAGISFSTPLATVHAFQGWADRFIGFPGAGVKDAYLLGNFKFGGGLALTTVLHDFKADAGGIDYGEEFDLQLSKKIGKFTVALKHASYFGSDDAAAGATGVDKTVSWLFVNYVL